MENTLDRRNFLKGSALVGASLAAAGLMGCSTGEAKEQASETAWDEETDVVVMGYGFAGQASAISAAANGSHVIIFEKAPEEHAGGNSAVSCGFLKMVNGDGAVEAWKAITDGSISDAECQAIADASTEMPQWFVDNIGSAEIAEKSGDEAAYKLWGKEFPNASVYNLAINDRPKAGGGYFLHTLVAEAIADRYADLITIKYEAPVTNLVYDAEKNEVVGVKFEEGGAEKTCKARKGVVMACGGFEANYEMVNNYVLTHYEQFHIGSPYNTGDGIKMVAKIGAKLRHMAAVEYGAPACYELSKKYNQAIACYNGGDSTSMVYVNQHGKRFMCEDSRWPAHDKRYPYMCFEEDKNTAETPNYPWWMVFDENRRAKGPLFEWSNADRNEGYAAVRNVYQWSSDNLAEIKDGVVLKADSFEELAKLMELSDEDAAAFVETMERYNSDIESSGADSVFGRSPDTMYVQGTEVLPVNQPPYYAVKCCISYLNTNGGPARNEKWQVLDWNDEPIGRLYSNGEFGSVFYHYYWGGGNINECFAGGMMCGKYVSELEPQDGE